MELSEQKFNKIDVRDLKKIVDAILDRMINQLNVQEIVIDQKEDYYWDIPSDSIFKVPETKPEPDIGRLSDDWEFLQNILQDSETAVSLQLIHVAPLLRWIGEKIGQ